MLQNCASVFLLNEKWTISRERSACDCLRSDQMSLNQSKKGGQRPRLPSNQSRRYFTILTAFAGAVAMSTFTAHAQSRTQARSMVVSRGGIVATESPLASQAGAMILARDGNAIDAAVAANAVVGVVEPMMNGMGGDLFVIVYEAKTGKLYGLNASGWAPAKLSIEFLHDKGEDNMPQHGIDSATVPGVVDGWSRLL